MPIKAPLTAAVIGLVAAQGFGAVFDTVVPHPIEVHDVYLGGACNFNGIDYDACIYQDRTVTPPSGAVEYFAGWRAWLIDMGTGRVVAGCSGSGAFDYPAGRKEAALPLHVWVGSEACRLDALPPGRYEPHAAWDAGIDGEEHVGRVFEIEATR